MPNQFDDDDDDDFDMEESNGPASLRKALKKAEKQNKALMDELASLRTQSRTRTVKDVLEAKGVNPKIAAFIPADVDAPEKIAAWLDEYADVFGGSIAQPQSDLADSADAMSSRRIDDATQNAVTPTKEEDIIARLAAVQSIDELNQLLGVPSAGR